MNLRQLAEAAGVDRALLWRIRVGERRATPAVAARLTTTLRGLSRNAGRMARQLARAARSADREV